MSVIAYNIVWMTWNILLAASSVLFGWLLTRPYQRTVSSLLAFLWLVFVPNTIYIITDLSHLSEQWNIAGVIEKPILIVQYSALIAIGIAAFVVSLYFFEYGLNRFFSHKISENILASLIAAVNFAIAFGVMVGRVQRTNSWEVFTNPGRVYYDIVQTLSSPTLLVLVFVFGVLGNIIYFSFRDIYKKPFYSLKKHLACLHA